MYDECKNYLIPNTKYYMMLSDLKMASEDPHKQVRQNYYLLSKLEILLCGDVEKQKRADSSVPPLYYVTIDDTFDIIKWLIFPLAMVGVTAWLKNFRRSS